MLTINEVLRRNRRRYPNKTAVVDEAGRLTYASLIDRAWALARGLLETGVRPGDHVGILTGNGIFSAETYLGVVSAGAVAVPYNWRWAVPELVYGINDSSARTILVEEPWAERLEEARATGEIEKVERVITQGDDYEAFLRSGHEPDVPVTLDSGNVILYTGGTTGYPKGVLLTHRSVMGNNLNEIIDTEMKHDDTTLLITPMFHAASLLSWFLPHVLMGATNVFVREFDEEHVGHIMERERVTNGFLVPNMVRRLLRAGQLESNDLSAYRRLYTGGATFRMPDKEAVKAALPQAEIYYQYGLTEAGSIVTVLRPEAMFREDVDGSIGKEFLLAEVQIQDPASGQELPAGEVGEICVRGPSVMKEYYGKPEATEEAFRNGWLRTGDVASKDEEGFVYFHDRLKDMIKTGGENVYSQEVEKVLYGHPGIVEAAVLGVASEEWDEEVRAVVALRDGHELTEQEIRDHCRISLAGYKIPKRVAIVEMEEIPVNPSGKIVKHEMRGRDYWGDLTEEQ